MRAAVIVLGIALNLFASSDRAQAQSNIAGPAYVVTYIEVAPEMAPKAAALLRGYRARAAKEAGYIGLATLQRRGPANHFALLEAWADRNAADAHAVGEDSRQFVATLQPMLIAPIDTRPHGGLAADDARTRAAISKMSAGTIYVLTHVDMIPSGKEAGLVAVIELAAASGKEAGNAAFAVLQQTSRPNHLTLFEAWQGEKAFGAHAARDFVKAYRTKLTPMSGALYDQRTYQALR